MKSTSYCDDFTLTRGLSHAYRKIGSSYVEARENAMAYNSDLRFCSTVSDLLQLWRAIKDKNLVRPETFRQMSTAEGAAAQMSAQDPKAQYGFAMILNHEEDHRRIGQHGSLMGYSGSLYDFPEDQLTIVVLTNTEDQNAYAITRALGRAILGFPRCLLRRRLLSPCWLISPFPKPNANSSQERMCSSSPVSRPTCMIPSRSIAGRIASLTKMAAS